MPSQYFLVILHNFQQKSDFPNIPFSKWRKRGERTIAIIPRHNKFYFSVNIPAHRRFLHGTQSSSEFRGIISQVARRKDFHVSRGRREKAERWFQLM